MDGWFPDQPQQRATMAVARTSWAVRMGDICMFLIVVALFYQRSDPGQNKPVPYDLLLIGAMGLYFLFGLKLPRGIVWPASMWGFVLAGYGIGGMTAVYVEKLQGFMEAATYLVCAMIFFAAYVYEAPERRLRLIFNAYTAGALVAASLGIGGYFGVLPGSESFLDFGRAIGTFNDPNVFGPYLIAPTIYLCLRLSTGESARAFLLLPLIGILVLGILLSFSRGAWGSFLLSSGIFVWLTLATSRSAQQSFRLIVFSALMGLLVIGIVGVALSTPKVQRLFTERAALVQDYDVGQEGRFESQKRAIEMVLSRPLGIGPSQWGIINKLDTHNVYLSILVAGGFLSGLSFLGFVFMTLRRSWGATFVDAPGREYLIVVYACLVGHLAEAFIIDVDNWRHLFLLFGMAWGMILATERQRAAGTHVLSLRRRSRAGEGRGEPVDGFPA